MTSNITPYDTPVNTVSEKHIADLANECVQCAVCLPHCPTYQLSSDEGFSPRGRISLMKAYAEGKLEDNANWAERVDSCLSCGACERACPAKVQYRSIFDLARALRTERKTRIAPLKERTFSFILNHPLLRRGLSHLGTFFPKSLGLPVHRPLKPFYQAQKAAMTADILIDCALGTFQPEAFKATAYVLNRMGISVSFHQVDGCCGGWWEHTGQASKADKAFSLLKQKLSLTPGPLTLYTLTSGCHQYLDQQNTLQVKSVYELIADRWQTIPPFTHPQEHPLYAHTPCTSTASGHLIKGYYQQLEKIPGVSLKYLPLTCCGAGGAMALAYPEKADKITAMAYPELNKESAFLLSSNLACEKQILRNFRTVSPLHPIFPLARALGYGK